MKLGVPKPYMHTKLKMCLYRRRLSIILSIQNYLGMKGSFKVIIKKYQINNLL